MNKDLLSLSPREVWEQFSNICSIPHPSYHEEGIREYIISFAKERGIEHLRDEGGNIILRKGATPGMEGKKGVILQAHMDMVPQKNSGKEFDFETDPIEAYIDGKWVKANGTTLGADNGIGMALILAVFGSDTVTHGPIEGLFTSAEEVGMDGAFAVKPGVLKGEILINLDSEDEGELCVGCAGGLDAEVSLHYKPVSVPANGYKAFRIDVSGLLGGHSGMDINLGRGNANKILNRMLDVGHSSHGMLLSSFDGGGLRNAIPREAHAIVIVPEEGASGLAFTMKETARAIKEEFKDVDGALSITATEVEMPADIIDREAQTRLINLLYACPDGVVRMSPTMPGTVQTSLNLARVVSADGVISITFLLRSFSGEEKTALGRVIRAVFEPQGGKVELKGGYDGWIPRMDSPILAAMKENYKSLGTEAKITAVHAGLECGILGGTYPSWDMISCGPTLIHPHSPDEKLEIASVDKFWKFLLLSLKNIPSK